MDWKVGDVVRLKSGGPKMTVRMFGNNGLVYCDWFNVEAGKFTQADHGFPPASLVKAEDK